MYNTSLLTIVFKSSFRLDCLNNSTPAKDKRMKDDLLTQKVYHLLEGYCGEVVEHNLLRGPALQYFPKICVICVCVIVVKFPHKSRLLLVLLLLLLLL